jgi:glycosyltransferase involved in cell wall biosynthesis
MEQLMARKVQKIIVNSNYLKEAVRKGYSLPVNQIFRLYKAVEVPPTQPRKLTIDLQSPIRVLFVKNDYQRGGLLILIEALSLLPVSFILTIVGPNPADKDLIMSKIDPVKNIVGIFIGKVPQQQVTKLLSKTHIFCVPSYKEALGVANLEAMAQGVPVVSTNVGGIPEVLDHGRCGWLVPPHDAKALAGAIHQCISDPVLRAKKITQAHARVKRFDTHTMFSTFLEIISQ